MILRFMCHGAITHYCRLFQSVTTHSWSLLSNHSFS